MSLRIKFLIGLTLLFTVLMAGLFIERVQSTRQYAQEQLSATAQDAASSLAYPLARALGKDDVILAETAIKALLDRGYYLHIEIISVRGNSLAKLAQARTIEGVPAWFVSALPLELTPGSALISDGWRQMGRVVVVSDPALAYQQLWKTLTRTTAILSLVYIISLLLMVVLVRQLLKPLRQIEQSAQQVQQRQFHPISDLPGTREFRRVVEAFNVMIERVRQFLAIEQQRAEEYRHQAFTDPISGLDNRRSLDLRIDHILKNQPHDKNAAAIAVQLANLVEFNTQEGYQNGDLAIAEFARALRDTIGPQAQIVARLDGTTLLALRYDLDEQQLVQLSEDILLSLRSITIKMPKPIRYAVAIVDFAAGMNKSRLLGAVDLALQQALYGGGESIQRTTASTSGDDYPSGSQEWREVLQTAIRNKHWGIQSQPVQTIAHKAILHHEITATLQHDQQPWIKAALFVPMAARHGLLEEAERSLFEVIIGKLKTSPTLAGESIALNMGLLGALGTVEGQDIFLQQLDKIKAYASRIAFEVPEHQLLAHPELAKRLAKLLADSGFRFGIDHFGFSASAASLMQTLRPQYVKIDRRLIRDMNDHQDSRQMIASLLQVADSLNILTIAQGVETQQQWQQLEDMQLKAAQGYLIGRPSEVI
ncbi:EAL domain-containing protein [Chitinibacter sp. FCG-7]|uniref:EAL domain-containing protein n=1 Tax=Chitinibacter mangrovi TaxID=3153927 RepID=A0AAU7F639_9NEIS